MSKNVFVMESKLTSVAGRRDYIGSKERQENLLATYSTTHDSKFWKKLAEQNRQQYLRTGQGNRKSRCVEARELIIALPKEEKITELNYQNLAKDLAEDFKKKYGVECDIAIHYNKTKTNLHAHLIFSERKELAEPVIKYTDRRVFINEQGIRMRTKKEILNEVGEIRHDCQVIEKGEVISSEYFDTKLEYFQTKSFLHNTKKHYAELLSEISLEKYKVFDHKEPYLPTKHIGKGPTIYEMGLEERNQKIVEYNNLVDKAMKTQCISFDDAMVLKKQTQEKIREANKLTRLKNEAVTILIKECEKLKSLLNKFTDRIKKDGFEKENQWFAKMCKEEPDLAKSYLDKIMNDEKMSDFNKASYQQMFNNSIENPKEHQTVTRGRHR